MAKNSIGMVELGSIAAGYQVCDAMLKAAEVELVLARSICSGKYMVMVRGEVGAVQAADPDSGDRVQVADFTALTTPGKYYLDIPGVGRSWEFAIGPDIYARAWYLAMRSYYRSEE